MEGDNGENSGVVENHFTQLFSVSSLDGKLSDS